MTSIDWLGLLIGSPFLVFCFMDQSPIVLYWNCRGACGRNLKSNISNICKGNRPLILVLAETKCDRDSRFLGLKRLGFDGISVVPSVGRSGGIVAVG